MAISRPLVNDLSEQLGGLYRALEDELAAGIAKRLKSGLEAEDWQRQKLAATAEVRRWINNTVRRAAGKSGKLAQGAISVAFERGAGEAQRELAGRRAGANLAGVQQALPGAQAINRLAHALTGQLSGAHLAIARSATDAYQQVVAAPAALALGGALTRRQAAERAWNQLLDQGFTGFTDTRGRKWTASGYVEMATRTATAQAAVQGHLDRMAELDLDLVIVSNASQECRLCRPWEGKILTRTGPDGARTIEAESELTGEPVKVKVAGSLSEAIRNGLFHPNCRHSISSYLPGLTKPPIDTADPEGDKARQQLRYLERETRKWKLREAGALSPEDKARAAAKVKARQQQITAHMKANPDLTRRRDREQLDLGNARRTAAPEPAPAKVTPVADEAPVVVQGDPIRTALDSGVKDSRQLGGGAMGRVDRLTMNDGTELVRKLTRDSAGRPAVEQQDAEELGALVVQALGGRAPRVLRTARDEVHMEFVDGKIIEEIDDATYELVQASEDGRRIAFSDVLMGNTDRNPGNVIIDAKGRPHGIDHGGAFDFGTKDQGYNVPDGPLHGYNALAEGIMNLEGELKPGILTKAEAKAMRAAIEALEPEFRRVGRPGWYRKMLTRMKTIERSAR